MPPRPSSFSMAKPGRAGNRGGAADGSAGRVVASRPSAFGAEDRRGSPPATGLGGVVVFWVTVSASGVGAWGWGGTVSGRSARLGMGEASCSASYSVATPSKTQAAAWGGRGASALPRLLQPEPEEAVRAEGDLIRLAPDEGELLAADE